MYTSNLCNPNLGELGEVLSAVPAGAVNCQEIRFCQDEFVTRYCSDRPVILDYHEGTSSLILYPNDQPQIYYLDRIVQLMPDVLFSVVPISKESRVRIFLQKDGSLIEKDRVSSDSLKQTSPSLEFKRIYSFFCQKSPDNFYFRGERHEPYELVYVDQGVLHTLIDGQDVILHPKECLIIGRDQWHIQFSDESVGFLTVSFDLKSPYLDPLTDQVLRVGQDLRDLFRKMVHELEQTSFSNDYIESLMKILLIELIRQSNAPKKTTKLPSTNFSENEIFNRALQQISGRITEKIDLQELAASIHISVPYLYVLFERHLGMPPGKYIMKIRIEESKLLLREGKLTIGEVGSRMGFSSIQHFSRQFRSVCGMSPSQYVKGLH